MRLREAVLKARHGNAAVMLFALCLLMPQSALALPPVTTINPDGSAWSNNGNIQFTLSCTDPDVGGPCVVPYTTFYKVINDGDSCGTLTQTGTTNFVTCPNGQMCTKRVCFFSRDNTGEIEGLKASDIFRIDRDYQSSVMTAPSNIWTKATAFQVAWNATVVTIAKKINCGLYSFPPGGSTGTKVLTISKDIAGAIHAGNPLGDELRCWDTGGTPLGTVNTDKYNSTLLRLSDPTNAHVEKNYFSTYANPIYLSSSDTYIECNYKNNWQAAGYDACLLSMSDETNAHVGGCGTFSTNLSCKFDNTSVYINNYTVQHMVINRSNGVTVTDWTVWLDQTTLLSQMFNTLNYQANPNNHTYFFRVSAKDKAGNTGPTSADVSVTVDTEPPEIYYSCSYNTLNSLMNVSATAWDNVSGVLQFFMNCTVTASSSYTDIDVPCMPAGPFGGVTSCSTPQIAYIDGTEVDCDVTAIDRAGNPHVVQPYCAPNYNHPMLKLYDHQIYISLGESYHSRIDLRNPKSTTDQINISLSGTYPSDLAYFLESGAISWISPDKRNISIQLDGYERKTVYLNIDSTDAAAYTIDISAYSNAHGTTDTDTVGITIGFPASFPGIEGLWIALAIASAAAIYWRKKL